MIEHNCRFGDPETQVVLPLLDGDLLEIMQATTNGTLAGVPVKWKAASAACVVLASGGYPQKYETEKPITGLVNGQLPGGRDHGVPRGHKAGGRQRPCYGGRPRAGA